jgi:hemerythrin-like domain-containing protein
MDSTERSVISVLTRDHRHIQELLGTLRAAGDPPEHRRIRARLRLEMVRHFVAEETYLYPAVGRAVPCRAIDTAKQVAAHTRIETIVNELERTDAEGPALVALVNELTAQAHQHFLNEEYGVFPWLAQSVSDRELIDLGEEVREFEDTAPTTSEAGLTGQVRDRIRQVGGASDLTAPTPQRAADFAAADEPYGRPRFSRRTAKGV